MKNSMMVVPPLFFQVDAAMLYNVSVTSIAIRLAFYVSSSIGNEIAVLYFFLLHDALIKLQHNSLGNLSVRRGC